MKAVSTRIFLFSLLAAGLFACNNEPEGITPPEPIGGLDPEAVIFLEGQNWFPVTVGVVVNQELESAQIYFSANSSAIKGFQRKFHIRIDDENMQVPSNGFLDYSEIIAPVLAFSDYRVFKDQVNRDSDLWRTHFGDRAGIRIDSTYVTDGVLYSSGAFYALPGNDDLVPRVQEINGLFHNVRVFANGLDMQAYFDRITELELYE